MDPGQSNAGQATTTQFILPWFMGAAWVPKFSGETNKFTEWRSQVEVMLRAQGLSQQQQTDFVLGALEGDAKREIMLLGQNQRDTHKKILDSLQTLYAKPATKSQLRANFFNCKQQTEESVGSFILRLRELYCKWEEEDRDGVADDLLLDQFMVGLQNGPIKQELCRQMRRQAMSFDVAIKEARALEQEFHENDDVFANRVASHLRPHHTDNNFETMKSRIQIDLKTELLCEIKKEIQEQLKSLSSSLVQEIKTQFSAQQSPHSPAHTIRSQRQGPSYQWDEQGRPICQGCDVAGHIRRRCPQRQSRSQDF